MRNGLGYLISILDTTISFLPDLVEHRSRKTKDFGFEAHDEWDEP